MEQLKEYLEDFDRNADKTIDKICLWMQNYIKNIGVKGFVLGMSGGLDCCTVAALCNKANIPCYLISMPYEKSMDGIQGSHSQMFANKFNLPLAFWDITDEVNKESIEPSEKIAYELGLQRTGNIAMSNANVAPRIRMKNLYKVAQDNQLLVIGTSNMSEITIGYFTKWGDGAADLEPIYDFTKSEVRILAKHLGVPGYIISKAPSADLWNGQTDEEEIGLTYDEIDSYILFNKLPVRKEKLLLNKIKWNEHKLKAIPTFEKR